MSNVIMNRKLINFNLILLACTLFILAGCYEKVDWEPPPFDTKPVMNSVLVTGKPVRVHVSLTVPYVANEAVIVEDAEVNLFIDGVFVETLAYQDKGYYQSQIVAEAGKEYVCEVHLDNFPVMRGSVTLPKPNQILGVEHINIAGVDEEGLTYPAVKLTFANDPDIFSCHEVTINTLEYFRDVPYWRRPAIINYIDPVLLNEGLPITVFSNEIIGKDSYTMTINYTTGSYYSQDGGPTVTSLYPFKVEFRTLSHCYYRYSKQLFLYEYNNEEPFFSGGVLTPFTLYSNIENGYGIFAGYSSVFSDIIDPNQ
jgi:hypothetical protein